MPSQFVNEGWLPMADENLTERQKTSRRFTEDQLSRSADNAARTWQAMRQTVMLVAPASLVLSLLLTQGVSELDDPGLLVWAWALFGLAISLQLLASWFDYRLARQAEALWGEQFRYLNRAQGFTGEPVDEHEEAQLGRRRVAAAEKAKKVIWFTDRCVEISLIATVGGIGALIILGVANLP